jgi:hypothetical protein
MKFYKGHNGVVGCCRELLKTQLNIAKDYCSCLVFFVEARRQVMVGKEVVRQWCNF